MTHQYTTKEVFQKFSNHIQHLIEYWTDGNRESHGINYSHLDGITHSIFASIAGVAGDLPGLLIVPINEIDYPQNYENKNKFKQNILPLIIKAFKEENHEFLEKNKNLLNIKSINYPYEESFLKNEESFNINLIRNTWQHIEYWHHQQLSDKEKGIGFVYSFLNTLDGHDLISKTMLVPYFTQEDVDYCKSEGENYYTFANYKLIDENNELITGGNMLHSAMYRYNPNEENEQIVREKYHLDNQTEQIITINKMKI